MDSEISLNRRVDGTRDNREIDRECSELTSATETANKLVHDLIDRIKPILRDSTPSGSAEEKEAQPVTDLGRYIRGERDRVRNMVFGLKEVISRLEL